MPGSAKLAMARLASAPVPAKGPVKGPAEKGIAKTAPHAPVLHAAAPQASPARVAATAKAAAPGTAPTKTALAKDGPGKGAPKAAPTKTAAAGTRPSRMAGIY